MKKLSQERKGQLALQILKHIVKEKGIKISSDMREEVALEAKQAGIPADEALILLEEIIRELVDDVFKP